MAISRDPNKRANHFACVHVLAGRKQIDCVTIWKLGRTVCVYSMVQRREKEKDSRYIQEASAPAAVTVYQTCNIMYICNRLVEVQADCHFMSSSAL